MKQKKRWKWTEIWWWGGGTKCLGLMYQSLFWQLFLFCHFLFASYGPLSGFGLCLRFDLCLYPWTPPNHHLAFAVRFRRRIIALASRQRHWWAFVFACSAHWKWYLLHEAFCDLAIELLFNTHSTIKSGHNPIWWHSKALITAFSILTQYSIPVRHSRGRWCFEQWRLMR